MKAILQTRQLNHTYSVGTPFEKVALNGVTSAQIDDVIIAYEPIWAIGTGMTATPKDANDTIRAIRGAVHEVFGFASERVRILYGGSMNEKNANALMSESDIDGGLIGGASLVAEKFEKVINYNK